MAAPLAAMRRWRKGNLTRGLRLPAFRHRGWFVALIVIAVVAIGFRIALPIMVTRYANGVLDSIPGYEGRIADVDIHLWRGAYTIHQLDIVKIDVAPKTGKVSRAPVLEADTIDLSVEWGELVRGAVVGQGEFVRPTLNLYAGPARKEQTKAGDDFISKLRELLPLQINRFAVSDGELHFRNYAAQPDVDIYLDRINLVARNLTNSTKISDTLVATVSGEARAMKSGRVELEMKIDPFAPHPTYDLALERAFEDADEELRVEDGLIDLDPTQHRRTDNDPRDDLENHRWQPQARQHAQRQRAVNATAATTSRLVKPRSIPD